MLIFPDIDPVAIKIGAITIKWYALAYIMGILGAWVGGRWILTGLEENAAKITFHFDNLISWIIIAVLIGGRVGYALIYDPTHFENNPIEILYIWQGGMSFHGALVGVMIAITIYCHAKKISTLLMLDLFARMTPFGLFWGRLANFVNQEHMGRITDLPWGVIFPMGGPIPRHPAQIYEALFEGVFMFILLQYYAVKKEHAMGTGFLTGIFLFAYGVIRFIIEFFRLPDGMIWEFTTGQALSFPLIIIGGYFIDRANNIAADISNEK